MTHPITINAARLTWDGRTPTGTELRAWLESLPGSEFATGLLILADALDREPDPDHIWLNAFKCIRPTDEFAAEVGRAVIARAMQSHPKRAALTVTAS